MSEDVLQLRVSVHLQPGYEQPRDTSPDPVRPCWSGGALLADLPHRHSHPARNDGKPQDPDPSGWEAAGREQRETALPPTP